MVRSYRPFIYHTIMNYVENERQSVDNLYIAEVKNGDELFDIFLTPNIDTYTIDYYDVYKLHLTGEYYKYADQEPQTTIPKYLEILKSEIFQ